MKERCPFLGYQAFTLNNFPPFQFHNKFPRPPKFHSKTIVFLRNVQPLSYNNIKLYNKKPVENEPSTPQTEHKPREPVPHCWHRKHLPLPFNPLCV